MFTKDNNQFPDRKPAEQAIDRMVGHNALGFIEDPYGTGTSFNVYTWVNRDEKRYKFLRSCYKYNTAIKALGNYEATPQPKHLRR